MIKSYNLTTIQGKKPKHCDFVCNQINDKNYLSCVGNAGGKYHKYGIRVPRDAL